MTPFTWQQYMIGKGEYARWVNAGSPAVQHRDYGRYLTWVLAQATAGVTIVRGRVTQVSLPEQTGRWTVAVLEPSAPAGSDGRRAEPADGSGVPGPASRSGSEPVGRRQYECDALVLTGPGVHRALPHDADAAAADLPLRQPPRRAGAHPVEHSSDIAIVGGGESALSAVAFLRAFRPAARMTVYTPMLPLSRGESFLENRVFSDPDDVAWSALDLQTRRDFVKHCDRGVFDPGTLASIAYDDRCRFVTGRVVHVGARTDGNGGDHSGVNGVNGGVYVDYAAAEGLTSARHDYLINCTGFDLLEQLRGLFSPALRAEIERQAGPVWERPPDTEVAIGRSLGAGGPAPAAAHTGPGRAQPGPRVREPRLPRAARQPRAAAARARRRRVGARRLGRHPCGRATRRERAARGGLTIRRRHPSHRARRLDDGPAASLPPLPNGGAARRSPPSTPAAPAPGTARADRRSPGRGTPAGASRGTR